MMGIFIEYTGHSSNQIIVNYVATLLELFQIKLFIQQKENVRNSKIILSKSVNPDHTQSKVNDCQNLSWKVKILLQFGYVPRIITVNDMERSCHVNETDQY